MPITFFDPQELKNKINKIKHHLQFLEPYSAPTSEQQEYRVWIKRFVELLENTYSEDNYSDSSFEEIIHGLFILGTAKCSITFPKKAKIENESTGPIDLSAEQNLLNTLMSLIGFLRPEFFIISAKKAINFLGEKQNCEIINELFYPTMLSRIYRFDPRLEADIEPLFNLKVGHLVN